MKATVGGSVPSRGGVESDVGHDCRHDALGGPSSEAARDALHTHGMRAFGGQLENPPLGADC